MESVPKIGGKLAAVIWKIDVFGKREIDGLQFLEELGVDCKRGFTVCPASFFFYAAGHSVSACDFDWHPA